MYLLYSFQIFKLRKRMSEISFSNKSEKMKELEMFKLYEEMLVFLKDTLTVFDM